MRKVLFIFGQLTEGDVDWLAESGRKRAVAAGETLIRQGTAADSVLAASVTAAERSTVLAIPRARLADKLREDPGFAARFYHALGILLAYRLRNHDLGYSAGQPLAEDATYGVELLLEAARRLGRADLDVEARRRAATVVSRASRHGGYLVAGDVPGAVYNPGLFQGVAGIGTTLLRLAAPGRVPSVLLRE